MNGIPGAGGMGDIRQLMQTLQSDDGIKQMMMRPAIEREDGTTFSQADMVADIVNVMRMDTKRIAQSVGVEVEIERMTPERAAELLQEVAQGEATDLVMVFDAIEEKRMDILEAMEGEEETDEWMEFKESSLYTNGSVESEQEETPDED